jgi:hypothetical protein
MNDPVVEHIFARYNPRAQFPGTQAALNSRKTRNDFIHSWPLLGIILNHIVDKGLHELKAISAFGTIFIDERITLKSFE